MELAIKDLREEVRTLSTYSDIRKSFSLICAVLVDWYPLPPGLLTDVMSDQCRSANRQRETIDSQDLQTGQLTLM